MLPASVPLSVPASKYQLLWLLNFKQVRKSQLMRNVNKHQLLHSVVKKDV